MIEANNRLGFFGSLRTLLSIHSTLLVLAFLSLIFVLFPAPSYSQSNNATLSGFVIDEDGALIVGANVTAASPATGAERSAVTNGSGYFLIPFLPVGQYTVRVQRENFATTEIQNVELSVNKRFELQVRMKVGALSESVLVDGTGSLIIAESGVIGTSIDRNFVQNLPVNGRSFQSLVVLAPGVVLTNSDATNHGQFSVNGQRADSNYFTVDGVGANFGSTGGYSLGGTVPATDSFGGTGSLVSLDALQEVRIQTSTYGAEYGRSPGAQVSVTTRSGTNQFQGTLFENFRNDVLDANDWFANRLGAGKPPLRHNDFGGTLGGPIFKDKTFFFFSYEGLRLRVPRFALTTVPSISMREVAPPGVQPFLNAFPVPNGRILTPTRSEFAATFSDPRTTDMASLRLDQMVSDKLQIFGRYNYAPSKTTRRGSPGSALNNLSVSNVDTRTFTVGTTWILAANVSNEIRFNYSKSRRTGASLLDEFGGAVIPSDPTLYPSFASPDDSTFRFTVDSASFSVGKSGGYRQKQINIVENLTVIAGGHNLRFGLDFRSLTPVRAASAYGQDINTTSALALGGTARTVRIYSRIGDVFPLYKNFSAYGQDTWKLSPSLTLTYGLRWELNPPPGERYGNYPYTANGGFDPAQMTLAPKGNPFWKTSYTNFAPRFGAAYMLSSAPGRETLLKGGIGIFYDLGMGNSSAALSTAVFPYRSTKTVQNVQLPLDPAVAEPLPFSEDPPYQEIFVFDRNLKSPRTYQWNIGIQQSLGSRQSLSVSYVAAAGRKLVADQFYGFPDTNPDFFRLHVVRDTGTSDYNSIQVQFERRVSQRIGALVSYTWGHSIDTNSNESSYLPSIDPNELRNDRSSSDFDVRHLFSAAITYEIPALRSNKFVSAISRDWTFGAIAIARTAFPIPYVTAYTTVCDLGFCYIDCDQLNNGSCPRPDLIPGVPVYLTGPAYPGGKRLNPAAFASPPPGRQGTLGRNALRGFPVFQTNVSLSRSFQIGEKLALSLTAEVFNILNHPNFGDPTAEYYGDPELDELFFGISYQMLNQSMSNPWGGAGQPVAGLDPIYQIGGPRTVQLAMKLRF